MKKMFLDTSAIYAYINRKDPDHHPVREMINKEKAGFVITNYIFDESVTLIRKRLGHAVAVAAGEILMHGHEFSRAHVTRKDEMDAWGLFMSRNDKSYSFTDCTSFIVMRRLNIKEAIALDEHFKIEGFRTLP